MLLLKSFILCAKIFAIKQQKQRHTTSSGMGLDGTAKKKIVKKEKSERCESSIDRVVVAAALVCLPVEFARTGAGVKWVRERETEEQQCWSCWNTARNFAPCWLLSNNETQKVLALPFSSDGKT